MLPSAAPASQVVHLASMCGSGTKRLRVALLVSTQLVVLVLEV